jgi:hypothetical protein
MASKKDVIAFQSCNKTFRLSIVPSMGKQEPLFFWARVELLVEYSSYIHRITLSIAGPFQKWMVTNMARAISLTKTNSLVLPIILCHGGRWSSSSLTGLVMF